MHSDGIYFCRKLILKHLYEGFLIDPSNRIQNKDVDTIFGPIENKSNFRIAREQLIQEELIEGKNIDFGNPRYFSMTGTGLLYYERNFIIPSVKREYPILVSKFIFLLKFLNENIQEISEFISSKDGRSMRVKIPREFIEQKMKNVYNMELNKLKWS